MNKFLISLYNRASCVYGRGTPEANIVKNKVDKKKVQLRSNLLGGLSDK